MAVASQMPFVSPLANILNKASHLGYEIPQTAPDRESTVLIQRMRELNQIRTEAATLHADLKLYERVQKMSENNIVDEIKSMETALSSMLAHIERIIRNKDVLSAYLQQPYDGDHIVVEVDYQADVQTVFRKMTETLNNVPRFIEALEWAARVNLDDDTIEKKLSGLSSILARTQRFSDALNDLRSALTNLSQKPKSM